MDTTSTPPARPKPTAMRLSIAVTYFVCICVIVGWSLRDGAAASRRTAPPGDPATTDRDPPVAPAKTPAAAGKTRSGGDCTGCGVVESVRRIDTYVEVMERCHPGEGAGPLGRGYRLDDSRGDGVEPLADIVAAAVVGKRGGKRFSVTTRHQIVVRFRNGSRRVLDESTPRALHEGERVIVIAGLGRTDS